MGRRSKGQTKQNRRKAQAQQSSGAAKGEDDDRFMDLAKNPMFREISKKAHKVKIDDRFKQMLTNKSFQERDFRVDKRGRPVKKEGDDYLTQIYQLDDNKKEDQSSGSEADDDELSEKSEENEQSDADSLVDNEEEEGDGLPQIQLDLARGQGNISSSSSDEEMDEEEAEEESKNEGESKSTEEAKWGELDKEVRRVEWASRRLAICNLDWSKVRAEDLMLVLTSFKPANGQIHSVSVYLSDFGAERTKNEKKHGPILKLKPARKGKDEDLEERTKQAIHAYELDKLRYYYAVCICDTIETATAIYEACDGVEYESSGLRFDVRFVPDEMEFETERIREQISSDQFDPALYKPKRIETHSLGVSNPKMSWEDADPERRRKLKEAFNEEAKLEEFDSLIASGSEGEEEEVERKKKYELLMAAVRGANEPEKQIKPEEDKEGEEEVDGGEKNSEEKLEVEWAKESARHRVADGEDRELSGEEVSDEEAVEVRRPKRKTKFQQYLERKKQLKQERKQREQEERKRRKRKVESDEVDQSAAKSLAEQVDKDERFTALFTDSAFAIDRTSASYKGGDLADRQVKSKQKKRQSSNFDGSDDERHQDRRQKSGRDGKEALLIEKLKRKSAQKMQIN